MIPVYQTIVEDKRGNCQAACIASIFEVPLGDIPDDPDLSWMQRSHMHARWLEARGLGILTFPCGPCERDSVLPFGYAILGADSPRFPGKQHALVLYNGRIVHDPHPDGRAIVGDWKAYDVFYALEPHRLMLFTP